MKHLAQRGIPVPEPQALPGSATADNPDGELLHQVCGKPAAVVDRLRGTQRAGTHAGPLRSGGRDAGAHAPGRRATIRATSPTCAAWRGGTRRCRWCCLTWTRRRPRCSAANWRSRTTLPPGSAYAALPRGPIHADLFRDNVMFEQGRLTGFFDFYFAGVDSWLFDIAVCLNDWCVDLASGAHDAERAAAFLQRLLRRAAPGAPPSAACCRPCCGPARCVSGSRGCGISTCRARPPCSRRMIRRHFERVLRQRVAHPPVF